MSPLATLPRLTRLELRACAPANLDFVSCLTSLEYLDLDQLTVEPQIHLLAQLQYLRVLIVSRTSIQTLEGAGSASLRSLDVSFCAMLSDFASVEKFTALEQLNVSASQVKNLSQLSRMTRLRVLNLSQTPFVADLSALSALPHVEELNLANCVSLLCLSPLKQLRGLRSLILNDCPLIRDISALISVAKSLRLLDIRGCPLHDLSTVASLVNLESLKIGSCNSSSLLPNISPLKLLQCLRHIRIENCVMLTTLEPISDLPQLSSMELIGLSSLRELPSSQILSKLRYLRVVRCRSLKRVRELRKSHPFINVLLA
jgi:hypothetical protein